MSLKIFDTIIELLIKGHCICSEMPGIHRELHAHGIVVIRTCKSLEDLNLMRAEGGYVPGHILIWTYFST
jgi:hypothetical protein